MEWWSRRGSWLGKAERQWRSKGRAKAPRSCWSYARSGSCAELMVIGSVESEKGEATPQPKRYEQIYRACACFIFALRYAGRLKISALKPNVKSAVHAIERSRPLCFVLNPQRPLHFFC